MPSLITENDVGIPIAGPFTAAIRGFGLFIIVSRSSLFILERGCEGRTKLLDKSLPLLVHVHLGNPVKYPFLNQYPSKK